MRAKTIKLIHVARRSLGLDDETYRSMLASVVPGKSSCRDMSDAQLNKVLETMKTRGFSPVSRPRPAVPAGIAGKIRAIWSVMHRQGFVTRNDDSAIDAYVKRITRHHNGGEGVARLVWLREEHAGVVLETLKKWHMRCMLEHLSDNGLKPTYERTCERYQQLQSK
ncbi:TPA: regulatory protein GemA [Salmonella enterica]|nr:regulatory protein GemA [Salmonella enterica]HEA0391315.1 regulatory protein GemA [Salmonella enterica]